MQDYKKTINILAAIVVFTLGLILLEKHTTLTILFLPRAIIATALLVLTFKTIKEKWLTPERGDEP